MSFNLFKFISWESLLIIFILIVILSASMKIIKEYERAIVFRLGRLRGAKGPGLIFLIPFIDKMVRMDTRIVSIDVPRQEIITKDNISVIVDAVVYYQVVDPALAVVTVFRFIESTFLIAQTTLRSIIGQVELDELLSKREQINQQLQQILDKNTTPWGIKISLVEVKEISVPEEMKRAMAKQAEAERERRAKIINAQGEYQSAELLLQAAEIINKNPVTLQLRYLQTLMEIATENNSTIVFPLPIELLKAFVGQNPVQQK